jgi:alpha-tubulin suppressor-like RCC1 family protein
MLPVIVSGLSGATAIAAGTTSACAVVAGGAVTCWGGGWGPEGPARDIATGPSPAVSQRLAPIPVDGLAEVTTVAIGENFACASRADLTLVCWGMNDVGQVGAPEVRAAIRPIMVTGVAWPVVATTGRFHACALRRDGKVKCWGRSDVGQVGPAGTAESSRAPLTVEGIVNTVGISAGARHTCALIADGAIRCWGDNTAGQLGRAPALKFSHTPLPIDLAR